MKAVYEFCYANAFDIDEHALARVGDVSFQAERLRKVEDIGPETDSLHDALDYDLSPLNHVAHVSIPAPEAQETSNIFSFGLSANESFRTLFISVFM